MTHALLTIIDHPLAAPVGSRPIAAGVRICDLIPRETPGAMVQVGDAWILREQWDHALQPGEHLTVHLLPAGNDARKALRLVLTIAATVYFGPAGLGAGEFGISAVTSAVLTTAATLAINVLLPIKLPNVGGGATAGSTTYDTALSGNRGAINQPMPVLYGRMRHFPPFAAMPYGEYDNDTQDQIYHALLCVGLGHYTLESLQIDDSDIAGFDDVDYAVLAPGEAPTLVLANVITSQEVADFPVNAGRSTPAITACRGGLTAASIGVDVVFPGGLGDATGGSVTNKSVTVRIDAQEIDDWGIPLAAWAPLGTETMTAASTEPVRYSFKYTLGSAARVQVRLVRTTARDDDPLVRNDGYWTGLRAYLDVAAPLAAEATYIEVRMRATEQLNGLTQRRLAVIARRLVRTWDAVDGWSAVTFTRNPAWAILDKLTDATYGNGLPDSRIDLATFADLAATWDERQDHLDIVIDTATDADEADQMMARVGRARCVWRNGVRTIVRDEAQTQEVAAYTGRDIVPGSVSLSYGTDASRIPDGIVLEYFSHTSWEWESITCPAPGVTTPVRPEYLRLLGITGSKQAEREGLYEAAARTLRRKATTFTTELQGLIPAYGSLVRVGLPLRGYGQHGDVVSYDDALLEAVLTEPPTWTPAATHYLTLIRPDGSVHADIVVTAGADAYTVVLASGLDFDPITDDARRERTRFIFGSAAEYKRQALLLGIRPAEMREDGAVLVEMSCINDAAAIHTADNALLPGEGEIQDPIDSPNAGGGYGGVVVIPRLVSKDMRSDGSDTTAPSLTITFDDVGVLSSRDETGGFLEVPVDTTYADEWVLGGAIDTADAALYEIHFTEVENPGSLVFGGAAFDTWLGLGTSRVITVDTPGWTTDVSTFARFDVSIREIATGYVQATCRLTAQLSGASGGA